MGDVLWWSMVLIGLILAAFVAAAQIKKRFVRPEDTAGAGFTLADLRALHRSGKMSDDEFERAKEVILATLMKSNKVTPGAGKPELVEKPEPPPPDASPPKE